MILKEVFSKNQNLLKSVVRKKILSKDTFAKSYIRGSLFNSETINIVDNNNSFSNLSVRNTLRIYGKNFVKQLNGVSLQTNSFFYKNKLNNKLKFRSFVLNFVRYKNLINSFYDSLKMLEVSNKKVLNTLLVLKPKKGGFNCYSSGVHGFLPRSHGLFLFNKALINVFENTREKKRIISFSSLINSAKLRKIPIVLRLNFLLGKVSFYPKSKRNSFSSTFRRRKRKFLANYNFVFLSQKYKKKNTVIVKNRPKNKLLNATTKKIFKK